MAEISGVTKQIELDTTKRIGYQMSQYSYWFSGLPTAGNSLELYSRHLIDGQENLVGAQHDNLRVKLYKFDKSKENVHKVHQNETREYYKQKI